MATPVHKTSPAEADIADCIGYLLERNPVAAERFVAELQTLSRRLAEFPEWYPRQRRSQRPEWQEVRMAVLRRFGHLVFYTFDGNTVVIRRVIHAARNLP